MGGIIFKILNAVQDGQNFRIVSVSFGDFVMAAIRIRKRIVKAAVLEDRDRDVP